MRRKKWPEKVGRMEKSGRKCREEGIYPRVPPPSQRMTEQMKVLWCRLKCISRDLKVLLTLYSPNLFWNLFKFSNAKITKNCKILRF